MRLFLIRHGAVIPPAPGALYGGSDVPLSATGENEARAAAAALAEVPLDHVIASPLARARFGAEQVIAGRDLRLELTDGLREIDRGRWVGLTPDQVEQRFPGELGSHAADPEHWRGHGGESLGDLRRRVLAVRDALLQRWRGKTVALVSHMMPTRALLADSKGLAYGQWPTLAIPTASLSLIDYSDTDDTDDDTGDAERKCGGEVRWVGYKPQGLSVRRAFPHAF